MRILSLVSFVIIMSCNDKEVKKSYAASKTKKDTIVSTHYFQDSILENKITDTLMKLDFVKKSHAYIDSFSHHKHGMAFMFDTLKKENSEFFVTAGYNGDLRFETYYLFYINPISLSIKVYDPITDQKLSIKEYTKLKK